MEQTLNSNSSLSDNNQTLQLDENLYSSVSMNQRPPTSTRIRSSVSLVNNEEVISTFMKSERLVKEDEKVTIQFKAAGNAPVLKQNKIKLGGFNRFATIGEFLKSALKNVIKENESIFLYCNSNFAPSPGTFVRDLYNNFAISGELIVYYALSEAWG